MSEAKILIVHPYDKSTKFLERIRNHLYESFGKEVHYFNIKPNTSSHLQCIERIRKHPEGGIIIYLGHGKSDRLYGSIGDGYSPFINEIVAEEYPEKYYFNDNFINRSNIEIFKGKKVFCLSCNSNSEIGKMALEKGAISFLGFGNMPSSLGEFKDEGVVVSNDIVKKMKTHIVYVIKRSLVHTIITKRTFEELVNVLQFITNQRLSDLLVNERRYKERYLLADYLYFFKKEIVIYGDKGRFLIE